jgi:tetratricopeptide (TPR) repeat protein
MADSLKKSLEEINKLIFVKHYEDAEMLLEKLANSREGRLNLLVQLRRIELALKLGKIKALRDVYVDQANSIPSEAAVWETCQCFAEQHGEIVSDSESVSKFQVLIQKYGSTAATFYGIGFSMECQGNYDRAIYNYEQSIKADPTWYPAYFGISQIYYHKGDDRNGDQFFYLFEQAAPYNLYGNFETHKNLCAEFLEKKRYAAAEAAITALSEWWVENKGSCPVEIQIYENLSISRISEVKGDRKRAEQLRTRALLVANQELQSENQKEGVFYFIAKVLEEFSEFELAFRYYKAILRMAGTDASVVQKIGGQFLSIGELEMARDLFEEGYSVNPNNPEIRFCRLVANLKYHGINVEDYLIGRERLGKLIESNGDRVELLALLHSLIAKFAGDPDVQGHMGDVYLRLGNVERAHRHYTAMYKIDGRCRDTATKYAAFVMQYGDPDEAMGILERAQEGAEKDGEFSSEITWLKTNYHARKGDFHRALELVRVILNLDPWNVSYLVQEISALTNLLSVEDQEGLDSENLTRLGTIDADSLDWIKFDAATEKLKGRHLYELSYSRSKLSYLYAANEAQSLMNLVKAATLFDASRGTYDFIRLLNTNFDGPEIYMALGLLFKDLWQLETATMWLTQVLMHPQLSRELKGAVYLELADCFAWQNVNLQKAVEYAKLAIDLGDSGHTLKASNVLAHAYLRIGKMREAKIYLEQNPGSNDHETIYLRGLLHYRNGLNKRANDVWKPLLTVPSQSMRFHNMKRELLRFYFDSEPYLKAN